jgi:hypothetical protein
MQSPGDYPAQAQRHYVPLRQYCDTKLAIVMAVQSLQRRFDRYPQVVIHIFAGCFRKLSSNSKHAGTSFEH